MTRCVSPSLSSISPNSAALSSRCSGNKSRYHFDDAQESLRLKTHNHVDLEITDLKRYAQKAPTLCVGHKHFVRGAIKGWLVTCARIPITEGDSRRITTHVHVLALWKHCYIR